MLRIDCLHEWEVAIVVVSRRCGPRRLCTAVTHGTRCAAVAAIIVYEGRQYSQALLKEYAKSFGLALHPCLLCLFWPCAFRHHDHAYAPHSDGNDPVRRLTECTWSSHYI